MPCETCGAPLRYYTSLTEVSNPRVMKDVRVVRRQRVVCSDFDCEGPRNILKVWPAAPIKRLKVIRRAEERAKARREEQRKAWDARALARSKAAHG